MQRHIIILDDLKFPHDDAEAYVLNCDHCHDSDIHFINDIKYWQKQIKKNDEIDMFTSIISHEWIHTTLILIENNTVSMALDNFFGKGNSYKEGYNGLYRLKYRLRDFGNKLK